MECPLVETARAVKVTSQAVNLIPGMVELIFDLSRSLNGMDVVGDFEALEKRGAGKMKSILADMRKRTDTLQNALENITEAVPKNSRYKAKMRKQYACLEKMRDGLPHNSSYALIESLRDEGLIRVVKINDKGQPTEVRLTMQGRDWMVGAALVLN